MFEGIIKSNPVAQNTTVKVEPRGTTFKLSLKKKMIGCPLNTIEIPSEYLIASKFFLKAASIIIFSI